MGRRRPGDSPAPERGLFVMEEEEEEEEEEEHAAATPPPPPAPVPPPPVEGHSTNSNSNSNTLTHTHTHTHRGQFPSAPRGGWARSGSSLSGGSRLFTSSSVPAVLHNIAGSALGTPLSVMSRVPLSRRSSVESMDTLNILKSNTVKTLLGARNKLNLLVTEKDRASRIPGGTGGPAVMDSSRKGSQERLMGHLLWQQQVEEEKEHEGTTTICFEEVGEDLRLDMNSRLVTKVESRRSLYRSARHAMPLPLNVPIYFEVLFVHQTDDSGISVGVGPRSHSLLRKRVGYEQGSIGLCTTGPQLTCQGKHSKFGDRFKSMFHEGVCLGVCVLLHDDRLPNVSADMLPPKGKWRVRIRFFANGRELFSDDEVLDPRGPLCSLQAQRDYYSESSDGSSPPSQVPEGISSCPPPASSLSSVQSFSAAPSFPVTPPATPPSAFVESVAGSAMLSYQWSFPESLPTDNISNWLWENAYLATVAEVEPPRNNCLGPDVEGIIIMSKAFRRELEAGMQTTHGMRCRNRAQQKRRRRRRREMSSASGVSPGSSSGQSNSDQDLSGCSLTSEDHSADELPSVGHLVSSRPASSSHLPPRGLPPDCPLPEVPSSRVLPPAPSHPPPDLSRAPPVKRMTDSSDSLSGGGASTWELQLSEPSSPSHSPVYENYVGRSNFWSRAQAKTSPCTPVQASSLVYPPSNMASSFTHSAEAAAVGGACSAPGPPNFLDGWRRFSVPPDVPHLSGGHSHSGHQPPPTQAPPPGPPPWGMRHHQQQHLNVHSLLAGFGRHTMLPPPSHNYSVDQFKWTHFDVDEGTELFPMVSLLSAGSSCMGSFSLPELAYIEHPVSLTERRMVFSADHSHFAQLPAGTCALGGKKIWC